MKAKFTLFIVLIVLISCSSTTEQQPNVIILLLDDAGYADFGFAGCKDLKTPHIDKLAADGIIFSDAHVSASVCGPSRAGLITGRYQQRFGFECNPDSEHGIDLSESTIADAMKLAGYKTAAFGKWHLGGGVGYTPNDRGFDYFWGFHSGGRSYFPDPKIDKPGHTHSIRENDKHTTFTGYLTDVLGQQCVDFIDRNKDEPFFIYWAPNAVHTPMHATKEDLALFYDHPRQTLAAMTWALDRAIGKIVDKLKTEGIYENTLIFFLSDNGGAHNNQSSNVPLKGYKGNKYEGGHRVPFVLTYPNVIKPGRYDGLSSSLDIFATAIDVAGISDFNPERPSDGVSLIPYLNNKKKGSPHQSLFWRKDKMAAARVGAQKLIRVEDLGYRMYNLEEDLAESQDLKDSNIVDFEELKSALENWEQDKLEALWTEGAIWDTITWLIHEDYYHNRTPRVKDPGGLARIKN